MDDLRGDPGGGESGESAVSEPAAETILDLLDELESGGSPVGDIQLRRLTEGVYTVSITFHGQNEAQELELSRP